MDMPKRPMSGYNRFVKARISDLNEKHPDKEVTELFPIMAEEWRMLENSEKEKYEEQYRIEMEKYKDKLKSISITDTINNKL
jgi:phage anti-repressor protein